MHKKYSSKEVVRKRGVPIHANTEECRKGIMQNKRGAI